MRNIDVSEIKHALEKLNHQSQTFRQHFAKLEEWRDRFVNEGNDAIEEFIAQHPDADRATTAESSKDRLAERNLRTNPQRQVTSYLNISGR